MELLVRTGPDAACVGANDCVRLKLTFSALSTGRDAASLKMLTVDDMKALFT